MQTEACKPAAARQSVEAMQLFLEAEISRPRPPISVGRDPVVWEIVRGHLAKRLRELPSRWR